MTLAPSEQPQVDRVRRDERGAQRDDQADPECRVDEAGVHRARDQRDHGVVDELHDGDRQRVRGEDDTERGADAQAGLEQRQRREQVAEEEREGDRQGDGPAGGQPRRRTDDQTEDLADGAPGQAVQGRADGEGSGGAVRGVDVYVVHNGTNYTPWGYIPGFEGDCRRVPLAWGATSRRQRGARMTSTTDLGHSWDPNTFQSRYDEVRAYTETLAAPLSPEDQTVQSMPDVSPTKWHRAHVTWFFETFVLADNEPEFTPFQDKYWFLFNSYYEGIGPRYSRPDRGLISRPGAHDVGVYRSNVDDRMRDLLTSLDEGTLSKLA